MTPSLPSSLRLSGCEPLRLGTCVSVASAEILAPTFVPPTASVVIREAATSRFLAASSSSSNTATSDTDTGSSSTSVPAVGIPSSSGGNMHVGCTYGATLVPFRLALQKIPSLPLRPTPSTPQQSPSGVALSSPALTKFSPAQRVLSSCSVKQPSPSSPLPQLDAMFLTGAMLPSVKRPGKGVDKPLELSVLQIPASFCASDQPSPSGPSILHHRLRGGNGGGNGNAETMTAPTGGDGELGGLSPRGSKRSGGCGGSGGGVIQPPTNGGGTNQVINIPYPICPPEAFPGYNIGGGETPEPLPPSATMLPLGMVRASPDRELLTLSGCGVFVVDGEPVPFPPPFTPRPTSASTLTAEEGGEVGGEKEDSHDGQLGEVGTEGEGDPAALLSFYDVRHFPLTPGIPRTRGALLLPTPPEAVFSLQIPGRGSNLLLATCVSEGWVWVCGHATPNAVDYGNNLFKMRWKIPQALLAAHGPGRGAGTTSEHWNGPGGDNAPHSNHPKAVISGIVDWETGAVRVVVGYGSHLILWNLPLNTPHSSETVASANSTTSGMVLDSEPSVENVDSGPSSSSLDDEEFPPKLSSLPDPRTSSRGLTELFKKWTPHHPNKVISLRRSREISSLCVEGALDRSLEGWGCVVVAGTASGSIYGVDFRTRIVHSRIESHPTIHTTRSRSRTVSLGTPLRKAGPLRPKKLGSSPTFHRPRTVSRGRSSTLGAADAVSARSALLSGGRSPFGGKIPKNITSTFSTKSVDSGVATAAGSQLTTAGSSPSLDDEAPHLSGSRAPLSASSAARAHPLTPQVPCRPRASIHRLRHAHAEAIVAVATCGVNPLAVAALGAHRVSAAGFGVPALHHTDLLDFDRTSSGEASKDPGSPNPRKKGASNDAWGDMCEKKSRRSMVRRLKQAADLKIKADKATAVQKAIRAKDAARRIARSRETTEKDPLELETPFSPWVVVSTSSDGGVCVWDAWRLFQNLTPAFQHLRAARRAVKS